MLFQLRQYFHLTMCLSWCGCTTLCLIIHPLKVIWIVSTFELLCIRLLWTLMYRFLCEHKFLFLWHTYPRGQFLGFIVIAIQTSTSNKCWRGCGEKGTLLHCWWECKLVQPLWRTVWRFLKKLEIELPYDPAIPLLGIHTEETRIERDTCTRMFITALFIIART